MKLKISIDYKTIIAIGISIAFIIIALKVRIW